MPTTTTPKLSAAAAIVDLPPTGQSRTLSAREDTDKAITVANLLSGWRDPEKTALKIASIDKVTGGRLIDDGKGGWIFRADANLNGTGAASITYTITDAAGKTATATALITIAAVNDAPVLAAQNFVLAPGTAKVFSQAEVLKGAYDIEGDAFKVVGVTNAVGGSVRLLADGTIRFVPKAGLAGDDVAGFTIKVRDAQGATSTVFHKIDLVGSLTGPDPKAVINEDAPRSFTAADLLAGWKSPSGSPLKIVAVTDAKGGTAVLGADGSVQFNPAADLNGKGAGGFTVTVSDGSGLTATTKAVVDITAVNDAPVLAGQSVAAKQGSTAIYTAADLLAAAKDVDGDALKIVGVKDASGGTVSIGPDGSVLFTPATGNPGSFTLTVADPSGATASAKVDVAVTPAADGRANLPAEILSAGEYLRSDHVIRPVFNPDTKLDALTTFGWKISDPDGPTALSDIWGYAAEIGSQDALPLTVGSTSGGWEQLLDRLKQVPDAKVRVYLNRDIGFYDLVTNKWHDAPAEVQAAAAKLYTQGYGSDGKLNGSRVWNYLAPQSAIDTVTKYWASKIAALEKALAAVSHKVDYVIDQGEWGPGTAGSDIFTFTYNPELRAYLDANYLIDPSAPAAGTDGLLRWDLFKFSSEVAARVHGSVLDAVKAVTPGLDEFIYYANGGAQDRGRYGGYWAAVHDRAIVGDKLSTIATAEAYFGSFNWGWTGEENIVRKLLNGVAQQIVFAGQETAYNWVTSGWRDDLATDAQHKSYAGFLKLLYITGQTGANAGYYDDNIVARDGGDIQTGDTPDFLDQATILGQVHAAFTWLDDFILDGHLVAGPDRHYYSKDLPAFELPVYDQGKLVDLVTQPVHALARINAAGDKLLVSVWAADANDRNVTVDLASAGIAGVGKVDLLARQAGTIYIVEVKDGKPVATLLDTDAEHPGIGVSAYVTGHDIYREGTAGADTLLG
ncbi:MAG: cadherin-like domain-containing protein, partial [Novosphingobium sp.]|nr:cadherin-like domain-containing protein [Novosphingobium sp.]